MTPCKPVGGLPESCKNLLPENWNEVGADQDLLGRLALVLKALQESLPPEGFTAVRVAGAECRLLDQAQQQRTVRVLLEAPDDMQRFPEGGTKGRDLVAGFLTSTADQENCWESRYGVVRRYDGWDREFHFISVRTRDATLPETDPLKEDVAIGFWKSWSLYSKPDPVNPRKKVYMLDELRRGAYVRCGTPHLEEKGRVNFIDCTTLTTLSDSATKAAGVVGISSVTGASVVAIFARLMEQYRVADTALLRKLRIEGPGVESAWGRCGNLGCCAAE